MNKRTFAMAVVVAAAVAACPEEEDWLGFVVDADFNPRLRPDLQPLDGAQVLPRTDPNYLRHVPPRLFSAGGAGGTELVSRPWPAFPTPGEKLDGIVNSSARPQATRSKPGADAAFAMSRTIEPSPRRSTMRVGVVSVVQVSMT